MHNMICQDNCGEDYHVGRTNTFLERWLYIDIATYIRMFECSIWAWPLSTSMCIFTRKPEEINEFQKEFAVEMEIGGYRGKGHML